MNIIILTGRFGMGHVSAAQAIEAALAKDFPDASIHVIDFIQYATSSDLVYKIFQMVVRRGEQVFNRVYQMSENTAGAVGVPMKRVCFNAFSRLLEEYRPDLVVSTLPFTTQVAGQYKAAMGYFPLITCITDTALHGDWVAPSVDAYMVACPETRRQLMSHGVKGEGIFITGVPVRPGFAPPEGREPSPIRRLLVQGGGFGLMSDDEDFYAALNALPMTKTTVICGSNRKLYQKLAGKLDNVEVLGYISNVEDYMKQADLLVTKPGGVTLFEAMACRLPILALKPFLAQEEANADFIQAHGIGWVMTQGPEDSVELIAQTLWNDEALTAARGAIESLAGEMNTGALGDLVRALTASAAAA